MFFSFEGIDGCGKSTQIRLVEAILKEHGYSVLVTREPGGTPASEAIRSILKDPSIPLLGMAELMLFFAARAELLERVILPESRKGTIVLCDRFIDSTYAYQVYGNRTATSDQIKALESLLPKGWKPDGTFILDLPVEDAMRRAGIRNAGADRYDQRGFEYFSRVREGYIEIAACADHPQYVLDGLRSPEGIAEEIAAEIIRRASGGSSNYCPGVLIQ